MSAPALSFADTLNYGPRTARDHLVACGHRESYVEAMLAHPHQARPTRVRRVLAVLHLGGHR